MKILLGERKKFFLGPDVEIKFTAPEDCECERKNDNEVIITLASLPECKIYLDVAPYDQKIDPSPAVPHDYNKGAYPALCDEIYRRFGFLPDDRFSIREENFVSGGWYRISWHDLEGNGMEAWFIQYDSWLVRVMAGNPSNENKEVEDQSYKGFTKEESSTIRKIVVDSIRLNL